MGGSPTSSGLQGADLKTRGDLEGSLCIDASLAGRVPGSPFFLRTASWKGAGILLPGSTVLSITLIQFAAAPVGTHYPGGEEGRL